MQIAVPRCHESPSPSAAGTRRRRRRRGARHESSKTPRVSVVVTTHSRVTCHASWRATRKHVSRSVRLVITLRRAVMRAMPATLAQDREAKLGSPKHALGLPADAKNWPDHMILALFRRDTQTHQAPTPLQHDPDSDRSRQENFASPVRALAHEQTSMGEVEVHGASQGRGDDVTRPTSTWPGAHYAQLLPHAAHPHECMALLQLALVCSFRARPPLARVRANLGQKKHGVAHTETPARAGRGKPRGRRGAQRGRRGAPRRAPGPARGRAAAD